MRRKVFLRDAGWTLCALAAPLSASAQRDATAAKPELEFSWERVPLYMHIGKGTDFSDEELKFIARFPLVTLEKGTGATDRGSTEAGIAHAAKRIKQLNPRARVLFYWNVILDYPMYRAAKEFDRHADWLLKDAKGQPLLVRNRVRMYDLTLPAVRDWWLAVCRDALKQPEIDGIFIDASVKILDPAFLPNQIGAARCEALRQGYTALMERLRDETPADRLLLANLLRARLAGCGLDQMKHFHGSYIEGFLNPIGRESYEAYVAKGIEAVQQAARQGYTIAMHMGPGLDDPDEGQQKKSPADALPYEEKARRMRAGIAYPLAIFLIVAERHSYFNYCDGYRAETAVWKEWYPEFDKPLGAPKGPAQRDGTTYTRQFEHASVWLDIGKKEGRIDWGR